MDRIARLRKSDLERKLRDARKVLREIACARGEPEHSCRDSKLAAWALELIFDEERAVEQPAAGLAMAPLPLENPSTAPAETDIEAQTDAEPGLAETIPFVARGWPAPRRMESGRPHDLLRELRG